MDQDSIFLPGSTPICSKIFVSLIPPTITNDQLREHFAQYGTIRHSIFITDPNTNNTSEPRGFGFVNFTDLSAVDRVIDDNNHFINGIQVGVDKCTLQGRKREGFKTNILYVYGIRPTLSSDALANFFGQHGRVISCSIDRAKCQGSVYFDSSKSVEDILASFGSWVDLQRGVRLEISKYVLRRQPIAPSSPSPPHLRHSNIAESSGRRGDFGVHGPLQPAVYNPAGGTTTVYNVFWQPYVSYGNISGANAMVPCYYAPPIMHNPQYGTPFHYGNGGAMAGYAGHYGGQNVLGSGSAGVSQEASGSSGGTLNATSQDTYNKVLFFIYDICVCSFERNGSSALLVTAHMNPNQPSFFNTIAERSIVGSPVGGDSRVCRGDNSINERVENAFCYSDNFIEVEIGDRRVEFR
ncbi:hypothetical protein PIB30_028204 [Stylosanthes scabra]|uniref:RRM domain-containing protein n=1 Tax=Stylosanthes scabra TaxID=79078 RepID=A0ABU6SB38_9FABA|nr:hypothetical protein [Stylosanthes scabra]